MVPFNHPRFTYQCAALAFVDTLTLAARFHIFACDDQRVSLFFLKTKKRRIDVPLFVDF